MPHVLLVDDEAALCDSLTYTLQKEADLKKLTEKIQEELLKTRKQLARLEQE